MGKKRAMTSEKASYVKRQGHADAREFAELLGIGKEYKSDLKAKKDVIDGEGYSYSVKSGEKKWQIFLYGKTRFSEDYTFKGMNGLGELFLQCIDSFPESRDDYIQNKAVYKTKLQEPMRELAKKFKEKRILEAFLDKSIFNSGEVDFLVIKSDANYHVFWGKEVVKILAKYFEPENSKSRGKDQFDAQKVVFKVYGKTCGEIEMRNDSEVHYREVKFWLGKDMTFELLTKEMTKTEIFNYRVILHGDSVIKKLLKLKKEKI